ncbi:hypothetical protein JXJ21_25850 [candidate division KSB1 bacterium]|nr:hypothetical protein [candidate division KSB1 bacterium]
MVYKSEEIRLLVLALFVTLLILLAQHPLLSAGKAGERASLEMVRTLEKNTAWNIKEELLDYFPSRQFIVNTRIDLYETTARRLGLPRLPDVLLSKRIGKARENAHSSDSLANEDHSAHSRSDIQQFFYSNAFRIRRIRITVLLDSSFSEIDRQFIFRVITLSAELNRRRGDKIALESLPFPAKPVAAPTPLKSPERELFYAELMGLEGNETLIYSGIFVVVMILSVLGFKRMKTRHILSTTPATMSQPISSAPAAIGIGDNAITPTDGTTLNPAIHKHKRNLIDSLFQYPEIVSAVLQHWIEKFNEEGLKNSIIFILSFSPRLLALLKNHLPQAFYARISCKMNKYSDVTESMLTTIYRKFDTDFRMFRLIAATDEGSDSIFETIQSMNEHQRFSLLKDMDDEQLAIVIAQLPPNQSAAFLKKLSQQRKNAIMAALSKPEKTSHEQYRLLLDTLVKQARQILNHAYISANGTESFVEILDEFDDSAQDEIIKFVDDSDSEFRGRMGNQFLKFNDIFRLPNEILTNILMKMDNELLATSFKDMPENELKAILELLPSKKSEKLLISMEMKHHIKPENIQNARRKLLQSARRLANQFTQETGRIVSPPDMKSVEVV